MTTQTRIHRRAAALLLTAAALSLTPAFAQEAQPPVDEPVADSAPPPVPQPVESAPPTPAPVPAPVATTPLPTPAPVPVVEAQQPPPAARATRTARPAPRAVTRAPARAAPVAAPQAAAPAAPAPLPAEAAAPAPTAEALPPPVTLPETPTAAPPAQTQESGGSILPWLIAGLLAAGALAFFLLRRRRRAPAEREAYAYDEPVRDPVGAAVEETPWQPAAAAAPAALAWEEPPHEPAVAAAAAPVEEGVPALDLELRPRRAGVTGTEAVVEFELGVANHGSAAARDVRVSTWMFPAGAEQSSEAERALIDRSGDADLHDIGVGGGESISRSVTLPTSSVGGDAVLPMVVAEARYRLPDGSEARTSATYAVGVPDGDELAHFAIDNPSGLHDEVVAWELGKTEPA